MATRRFLPKNETIFTGAIVASALVLALRGWLLFRSGDNILAYAADPGAAAAGILGEQLALAVLRLIAVILDVAAGLAIMVGLRACSTRRSSRRGSGGLHSLLAHSRGLRSSSRNPSPRRRRRSWFLPDMRCGLDSQQSS